ncbi:hypothetical protein ZHAS_00009869 [Anopheles sinensis]|uniref:Uncharacterized protein n=1 Tax=Anopheles sinensis TaxID=74873 RepID=A0A084VW34_ANOSI|nr:hypothetical protein ZHAS_00009869 [Anopheles sinensis]
MQCQPGDITVAGPLERPILGRIASSFLPWLSAAAASLHSVLIIYEICVRFASTRNGVPTLSRNVLCAAKHRRQNRPGSRGKLKCAREGRSRVPTVRFIHNLLPQNDNDDNDDERTRQFGLLLGSGGVNSIRSQKGGQMQDGEAAPSGTRNQSNAGVENKNGKKQTNLLKTGHSRAQTVWPGMSMAACLLTNSSRIMFNGSFGATPEN